MKYCENCGNGLPEDAKFCGKCGEKVIIDQEKNLSNDTLQNVETTLNLKGNGKGKKKKTVIGVIYSFFCPCQ